MSRLRSTHWSVTTSTPSFSDNNSHPSNRLVFETTVVSFGSLRPSSVYTPPFISRMCLTSAARACENDEDRVNLTPEKMFDWFRGRDDGIRKNWLQDEGHKVVPNSSMVEVRNTKTRCDNAWLNLLISSTCNQTLGRNLRIFQKLAAAYWIRSATLFVVRSMTLPTVVSTFLVLKLIRNSNADRR